MDIKSWLSEQSMPPTQPSAMPPQMGQFASTPQPPEFQPNVNQNAMGGNSPMANANQGNDPQLEEILSKLDQIDTRLGQSKVHLRRFVQAAMQLPPNSRSVDVGNSLRQILLQVVDHIARGNDASMTMRVARQMGQSGLQNSGESSPLRP